MIVDVLQEIAPLELAADWDNTGLLLEPSARPKPIARVLLTIDLTAAVVAEAVRVRAGFIVAYHPPIFHGVKQLRASDPQQRVLLAALEAGLAVYSPHTALDAAPGGLADWLAEGVAGKAPPQQLAPCGDGEFGRVITLQAAVPFVAMLARIKRWLAVRTLRVALSARGKQQKIRTVGVAAGSGGAALRGQHTDLWLTGELSHHDALAAVAAGTTVVLAEHSNSERGFLRVLQKRLREPFGKVLDVRIAQSDREPFTLA
ncbi:MAG: Nif3-like dinuclear metal center hexameric protein [Planctomycetota bacterium]|jgi:dinuclear metal center YbgI/SA1388 family protein|nr:Nif3-like dinuclear metal center hexameric protein [Planctomycetota bacterium]